MDQKLREAIGILRHQIISPVLMESGRGQLAYFKQLESRDFDVPGKGPRRFTATTMKGWLHRFRKKGFGGLVPKARSDKGTIRVLSEELKSHIREERKSQLHLSCIKFYNHCLKLEALGTPPVCIETLRRFLKSENLYKTREVIPRKKFEMSYFGELWTCDFMHGPLVLVEQGRKRRSKAILMAIIDDYSRMIVGGTFGVLENTQTIEHVFKEAILGFGVPDRLYCDNGSAFSSHYLDRVCAHLNIGLVHSKPYDSPSRGKIERFFRTVRENFLVDFKEDQGLDLKGINEAFQKWLQNHYHITFHHGIQGRPMDRYQISTRNYPRKRFSEEHLDEFFLVSLERTVNKDCTVSLHSIYYEVPSKYIGQRVELRFPQDRPNEVYLYENDVRVQRIKPVDSILNGKTYQPSPRISNVALHQLTEGRSS